MTSRIGAKCGALLFVVALWPCAAAAGAWPQREGHWQVIVPFTTTVANDDYDAKGDAHRRNRFTKRELQPYIEYGLFEHVTLVNSLYLTHEQTSWLGTPISESGLSQIETGARFALGEWQDTYFSLQPMLIWHGRTKSTDSFASQRGDIDGEFSVTMGQHFKWMGLDGFSDNLIGIVVRPANRPSEFKADLTLGVSLAYDIQAMIKSESYATFTQSATAAAGQIQSNKLGLSIVRKFDKTVSLELHYMASVTGRNTIKEQSAGLAIWYSF